MVGGPTLGAIETAARDSLVVKFRGADIVTPATATDGAKPPTANTAAVAINNHIRLTNTRRPPADNEPSPHAPEKDTITPPIQRPLALAAASTIRKHTPTTQR